jgi:Ca2+/Na+ antiporter
LGGGGGGGGDDYNDDDGNDDDGGDGDDDDEDEEASKLTPAQIKVRAYSQLAGAMVLVTLFSDPMCDVLGELGARLQAATGLANAAFYIAFVVTPVISNATEIISSVIFASRKTQASAVITYAQLLGAAAMNNSFCLAIFLAIVYIKKLDWNYSAEVLVTLLVEAVMCAVAVFQKTPVWRALIPLSLYPLALVTVYALERAGMS